MTPDDTALITAAVAGIGGIAFALHKLRIAWVGDSVIMAAQAAQKALVEQLHDELNRLSSQNSELATQLDKLQLHICMLTGQITLLTAENQQLKVEISALSAKFEARATGADYPATTASRHRRPDA